MKVETLSLAKNTKMAKLAKYVSPGSDSLFCPVFIRKKKKSLPNITICKIIVYMTLVLSGKNGPLWIKSQLSLQFKVLFLETIIFSPGQKCLMCPPHFVSEYFTASSRTLLSGIDVCVFGGWACMMLKNINTTGAEQLP